MNDSIIAQPLHGSDTEITPTLVQATTAPAPAPGRTLSEAEIQEGRARLLEIMRTGDQIHSRLMRSVCSENDVPASVASRWANGNLTVPEAVDECLTAITRQVRMGNTLVLYRQMARDRTGSEAGYETLPQRLADAIGAGRNQLDLGRGRSLPITSGLALDVGFVGGFGNRGQDAPVGVINDARLRAATEQCTTQRGDNRQCFTVGYVQGTRAYEASRQSAALEPGTTPASAAPNRLQLPAR